MRRESVKEQKNMEPLDVAPVYVVTPKAKSSRTQIQYVVSDELDAMILTKLLGGTYTEVKRK